MDAIVRENVHQLPADEVLQLLGTDATKGLDILELQARQARFGPNLIPAAKGLGPWMRFLLQFHTPLVYILLAAAAITAFLHEWVDSGVIFAVVLVNAVIGFLQESIQPATYGRPRRGDSRARPQQMGSDWVSGGRRIRLLAGSRARSQCGAVRSKLHSRIGITFSLVEHDC